MKKLFLTTAIILGFAIGSNADDEAGLYLPGDGLHGIRGNADGTDTYFDDTNWDWQSHLPSVLTYDVTMKEGTLDAGNWEINPANAASGTEITLKYNGKKKVKNITIEKAAEAAPAIPVTEAGSNEWKFTMPDYAVVANVEYDTELALNEVDDNAAKLDEWDGYEANITLTRTLVAGSWNTLAVPFNVSSQMLGYLTSTYGMSVKQLASTSLENDGKTLMLNFTDATEMVAGTPYLVKVSSDYDFSARALPNTEVSQELNPVQTTYADFIPTLGKTLVTGPEGDKSNTDAVLFLAADNKLKHPSVVNDTEQQSSYLKGFRAYFQLKGEAASLARAFSMNFGDGETTGIMAIGTDRAASTDNATYTLDGRRISKATQKGVYIQNGKKVIIK